jgi:hypothetical protein
MDNGKSNEPNAKLDRIGLYSSRFRNHAIPAMRVPSLLGEYSVTESFVAPARKGLRALGVGAALMIGAMAAIGAHATVIESVTTNTAYTYGYEPAVINVSGTGDSNYIDVPVPRHPLVPGQITHIALDTQSTVGDDAFYFLQNNYCIGYCQVSATTTTTVTLTNDSDAAVDLRFDSEITAGHIAFQGNNANSSASFNFSVKQDGASLYSASGTATAGQVQINTPLGLDFNGLNSYNTYADGGNQIAYD